MARRRTAWRRANALVLLDEGMSCEAVERSHGGGQATWIDRALGNLGSGSEPRKDGLAQGY